MDIGAAVAFVGVLSGFILVRQRDFVIPTGPGGAGSAGRPGAGAPADAAVPAAHA
jgi:hypothetical protein